MDLEVLRAAGWSPNSLLAALSPVKNKKTTKEPERRQSQTDENNVGSINNISFLSPSQNKPKTVISESPLQMLTRRLGGLQTLLFDQKEIGRSPSSSTPIPRHKDMKKTPSPSRFNPPLSGLDLNSPYVNPRFRTAKSMMDSRCIVSNTTTTLKQQKQEMPYHSNAVVQPPIVDLTLDDPLPNGWVLFEHQKEAIRQAIQCKRSILAYDMGK
jgi:hypothetical protein